MQKFSPGVPRYVLVQKEIVKLVKNWDKSKAIPNEETLAKEMGVSRTTVREAIQGLVDSGVLIKKHGIGTFIRENYEKVTTGLQELRGVSNIIKAMDMETKIEFLNYESVSGVQEVASALEIPVNKLILKIDQVYLADNKPVMFARSYINPSVISKSFEDFAKSVITGGERGDDIFKMIEEQTPESVNYVISKLEAVIAKKEIAEILKVNEQDPLLCMKDTHYNKKEQPLLYCVVYLDTRNFVVNIRRIRKY